MRWNKRVIQRSIRSNRRTGDCRQTPPSLRRTPQEFDSVEPTDLARLPLTVDVSAVMDETWIEGSGGVSPAHIAAAMALTLLHADPQTILLGFDAEVRTLRITASSRRREAFDRSAKHNGGGTDGSIPLVWVTETKTLVDACIIFTNNET